MSYKVLGNFFEQEKRKKHFFISCQNWNKSTLRCLRWLTQSHLKFAMLARNFRSYLNWHKVVFGQVSQLVAIRSTEIDRFIWLSSLFVDHSSESVPFTLYNRILRWSTWLLLAVFLFQSRQRTQKYQTCLKRSWLLYFETK